MLFVWAVCAAGSCSEGQEGCGSAHVLVRPAGSCCARGAALGCAALPPSLLLPQGSVPKRALGCGSTAGGWNNRCSHSNCGKERHFIPVPCHGAGILLIVVKSIQQESNKNDLDVDGFSSIVV